MKQTKFLLSCTLALMSFAAAHAAGGPPDAAQAAKVDKFVGVWQIVPMMQEVPGAPKATGDLADIALTPAGMDMQKTSDLKWDPDLNCRAEGPVRMMAHGGNRIELLPSLTGGFMMIFKDGNRGNRRQIEFKDKHMDPAPARFNGESIASWKDDDFVADTTGFNGRDWLNAKGAPTDKNLHMVETYHLLPGGQYFMLTVTVDDPGLIATPFTYTRYYMRQTTQLMPASCQEPNRQNP